MVVFVFGRFGEGVDFVGKRDLEGVNDDWRGEVVVEGMYDDVLG